MRQTKVTQICRKTGNLRAVRLLLGHVKMDNTVRYPGVALEGALAIAEAVEIHPRWAAFKGGPSDAVQLPIEMLRCSPTNPPFAAPGEITSWANEHNAG